MKIKVKPNMQDQDYFLLIHKKLNKTITPHEDETLNQWLVADKENQQTFELVKTIWLEAGEYSDEPLNDVEFDKELALLQERVKSSKENEIILRKSRASVRYLAIAVVFLMIISTGLFIGYRVQDKLIAPTSISINENRQVILSDSSSVLLNKESSIIFTPDLQERKVELIGEAFFDVTKDRSRPFCIYTHDVVIRVKGTSLVVKAYRQEPTEVIVVSGKVEVIRKGQTVWLTQGEKIIVNPHQDTLRSKLNTDPNYNSWYTHELHFKNTPLSEVLKVIETNYQVKFKVINPEILTCRFTGQFNHSSMEVIMETLSFTLDFKYSFKKDNYVISGKGCKQYSENK